MMFGPLVLLLMATLLQVDDEPGTVWLKSTINPDVSAELLIASRRYTHPDLVDRNIWLVGVSHIGESDFYESLSELMADHDLVLYESVMEQASRGGCGDTPESRLLNTNATMHWLASLAASVELTDGVAARSMDDLQRRSISIDRRMVDAVRSARTDAWGHPLGIAMNGNQSSICSLGRDGLPGGEGSIRIWSCLWSPMAGRCPRWESRNHWPEVSSSTINSSRLPEQPNWIVSDMTWERLQSRFQEEGIQRRAFRACSGIQSPGGDREGTHEIDSDSRHDVGWLGHRWVEGCVDRGAW